VKTVFLIAIGVFELGSLICAVAPSSTALIIGRAIAGMGVGGIFSGALVIIAHSRKFVCPGVFYLDFLILHSSIA
jgi:predicted MFS family arabinose efflux permease